MFLSLYRALGTLATPFLRHYLRQRQARGKEHATRMEERWGMPSLPRPEGRLIWLHAASVGEAQSVLPLLQRLSAASPDTHLLLTTGTVTSAAFVEGKLPKRAFHQFVPVDTPQAVERFVRYWHPDLAVWTESELWPNLILTAREYGCKMALINARLSARSFGRWQRFPGSIRRLLHVFDLISAQAQEDADRLEELSGQQVEMWGNLKYDAAPLTADAKALKALQKTLGKRPVWLAASTHAGEEAILLQAQAQLRQTHPDLLWLLIPRHPERGAAVATELRAAGCAVSRRSTGDTLTADTQVYLADTLGELGLFYRLSSIVFMGGSLVPHGGQNPLEAARLDSALLTGPYTQNFTTIYEGMRKAKAVLRVTSPEALTQEVNSLLTDSKRLERYRNTADSYVRSHQGALEPTLTSLLSFLTEHKA